MVLLVLVLSALLGRCLGYPGGAPAGTCTSLFPRHGGVAQQPSASPFALEASSPGVAQGGVLQVVLASPSGLPFAGFVLQARDPRDPARPLGAFSLSGDQAQLMDCGGGKQNSVTHTSKDAKQKLQFQWTAPTDYEGPIKFNATVVQDYATFFTNVLSGQVDVSNHSGDTSHHSTGISTTHSPRTTTTPAYTAETDAPIAIVYDPFYKNCSVTKSCFGVPSGCMATQSCDAISSVLVKGEEYIFEIKGKNVKYAAVGLSLDDKMGDDSVVQCVPSGSSAAVYSSWNEGKKNIKVLSKGISLLKASYVDGDIYCQFTREKVTSVRNTTFNLVSQKYHLLVAAGTLLSENGTGPGFHNRAYGGSGESCYLSEVCDFSESSKLLIRLHGALMVAAWIGAASVGILLARYYKQTWSGSQLCGKDIWFAWHRVCMLATWGLTMAGFVVIFVELQAWSSADNPHAIVGCVTTVLAFFQPIGAAFRPHPGSRKRPVFNWLHWLVGNVTHILAIVTIFFATELSKAELPKWMYWILVAYIVFYVVVHLILSISGCVSDRTMNSRVNSFAMKDMTSSRVPLSAMDGKRDAPLAGLRKFFLGIYLLVVILLTVALIVVVVLAPIEKQWKNVVEKAFYGE
ncbi:putative ferric-chelate reductase 1 homolog [Bacillus rossius redtenbacheri]|uniref:putative ferric-chelate reductase 1 homolog n=1 Tax=Bacillus rossius redtenbacheri TaxID=93214 RepID=UPI002FDE7E69